ncbi:MAG: hypothetical protein ACI30N_04720 [Muribaculaceae bacterium]
MKKFLLSLIAVLTMTSVAMAETYTLPAADKKWNNYTWTQDGNNYKATVENFNLLLDKGSSTSDLVQPDQYSIRVYAGAQLTITAPAGVTFKNVVVTINTTGNKATAVKSDWSDNAVTIADNKATLTNATAKNSITIYGDASKQLRVASLEISTDGTVTPDPDPDPDPTPDVPESSIDNPLTVAKALEVCADNGPQGVFVKGYVTEVTTTWSDQYKNVSFNIADTKDGSDVLLVFRAKWGADVTPTANNDPEVGATVIISGDLKIYNGTKEFNSGCQIVKYTAPEGGDTPTPDPVDPTGEKATYNFTDITSLNPAYDPEEAEADGTTGNVMFKTNDVVFKAGPVTLVGEGTGNNRLYYSSSAKAWSYRIYKNTTVTIAATGETTLNAVVFETATSSYATALGNAKFSVGTYDKSSKTLSLPEGTKSVVITPSATTGFNAINVYYNDPAGVNDIVAEDSNAPVEYYNLQGVRVANPENGLYIRVQGKKATKVLVK